MCVSPFASHPEPPISGYVKDAEENVLSSRTPSSTFLAKRMGNKIKNKFPKAIQEVFQQTVLIRKIIRKRGGKTG